jgi:hypothetical protein
VLCDISIFNPNVFFEFGIRTALDKPVALVCDDKTTSIPFHPSSLHCHEYDSSLAPWTLKEQKKKLAKHVQEAYKKSKGRNALWKYFGVAQTGTFKPEDAELGAKVDLVVKKLSAIEMQQKNVESVRLGLLGQILLDKQEQEEPQAMKGGVGEAMVHATGSKFLQDFIRSAAKKKKSQEPNSDNS